MIPLAYVSPNGRTATLPATLSTSSHRGKSLPVSKFTGEDPECQLDDWLSTLERACMWNSWTGEDNLIQLAGHLRGRALQEYNLIRQEDRNTFAQRVDILHLRIDVGSKAAAVQDFQHIVQSDPESVSYLIQHLELTFRIVYGRSSMSSNTKDTLLYSQMKEGLQLKLMKGPAVSGAMIYQ